MNKKASPTGTAKHKKLTIEDVKQLGSCLIDVSDAYPTQFLTERDFFPLVVAYLKGRVPGLETEATVEGGVADFRLGGPNDTWLELAVQPRQLRDHHFPELHFPGHAAVNTLFPSQNKSELSKLKNESKGKTRFLLLVDLTGEYGLAPLKKKYQKYGKSISGKMSVRVVYVTRDPKNSGHFLVTGHSSSKGRRTK